MVANPTGATIVGGAGVSLTLLGEREAIRQLQAFTARARAAMNQAANEVNNLDRELAGLRGSARAGLDPVARGATRAKKEMNELSASVTRTRTSMLGLATATSGLFVVGAGINRLRQFGQAMSTVRAITGATASEFEALESEIKRLGASTRFSAVQAAEGATFLARAGFNPEEILGSLEGSLNLAQAGDLGLGDAADIVTNILTAFREDVSETGRFVDVLAKTANSANTDIRQLGDAMKFVAPISSGLGVSVEDTSAAIAALSNAGLQAELAGTGLRRVLARLEAGTSNVRKVLDQYGISVEEVRVSSVGAIPALRRLAEAGVDINSAFGAFGDRGGPAAGVLLASINEIEEFSGSLEGIDGFANDVARTMDDNLNGAFFRLVSALEAVIIAMGDVGVTDALINSFNGLASVLRLAAENADILGVAAVALTIRALIPLGRNLALNNLISASGVASFHALAIAKGRMGAAAVVAGTAVRGLGASMAALALNPLTLTIGAAAAAFIVLSRNAEATERSLQRYDDAARETAAAVTEQERLTDDLERATKRLEEAQLAQSATALATARREVESIKERLSENERLIKSYEKVQEAAAERALRAAEMDESRSFRTLGQQLAALDSDVSREINSRTLQIGAPQAAEEAGRKYAEEFFESITKKSASEVTAFEAKFVKDFEKVQLKLEEARTAVAENAERERQRRTEAALGGDFRTFFEVNEEDFDKVERAIARQQDILDKAQERQNRRAIVNAEKQKAILENARDRIVRGRTFDDAVSISTVVFEGSVDEALIQAQNDLFEIEKDLATARRQNADGVVARFEFQRDLVKETIKLLEQGVGQNLAGQIAKSRLPEFKTPDQVSKDAERAREKEEREAAAEKRRAEAAEKRARSEAQRLARLDSEVAIQAALRAGDADLVQTLERQAEIRDLESDLIAAGVEATEARVRAERDVNAEFEFRAAQQAEELATALELRDLNIAADLARREGNDRALEAAEKELDLRSRIADLERLGLSTDDATTRAIEEQATLNETAREKLRNQLKDTFASAIGDAIRTGDWREAFQNILGSAAERALESAINTVSDGLAALLSSAIKPGGGVDLGGALNGALGSIGFGQTPPILDEATSQAVQGLGQSALGASEGADKAADVLAGALTTGALQSVAATATQNSATVTTTSALAALTLAAQASSVALTQLAASTAVKEGEEQASGILNAIASAFGGGRATGGNVSNRRFYVVGEEGPEIFVPNANGFVIPNSDIGQSASRVSMANLAPRQSGKVIVEIKGARGDAELQRMVAAGVAQGVKQSDANAGPASENYSLRFR